MTVLVPKASEPEKRENADEKEILECDGKLEINIPLEKDEIKMINEKNEENSSKVIVTDKNFIKRKMIMPIVIWIICLTVNNSMYNDWTYSTNNKLILGTVQAASIAMFSWLYVHFKCKDAIKNQLAIPQLYYSRFIAPIILFIIARLLIYTRFVSTSPMGETYSITIETLLPVCMLVGSAIILGSDVSIKKIVLLGILTSLASIFLWNFQPWRLEFQISCAFAILLTLEMVFAKKVMQEKRVHPQQLLVQIGSSIFCMLVPIFSYNVFLLINYGPQSGAFRSFEPMSLLVYFIHGVACWGQTAAAFTILSMKSPFEFSVTSIITHLMSALLLCLIDQFFRGLGEFRYLE